VTQVVLIRGINVGGKNKVPMAGLRELLLELGAGHSRRVGRVAPAKRPRIETRTVR
jgi:hypothetical protein